MSARIWSTAFVASVLLHGAGLGAIALSTEPEPLPDQPAPKSRFSIEAAEVPRSQASPETPTAQSAAQATAPSTTAQRGEVPLSRAKAAQLPSQPLSAARAQGTALAADQTSKITTPTAALETTAPALNPVGAPASVVTATSVPASAAAPQIALASAPAATTLNASSIPVTAVAPSPRAATPASPLSAAAAQPVNAASTRPIAATPAAAPAPLAPTSGTSAAAAPLLAPTAASAAPQSDQSAALPLPATAGTASLAWSGNDDAPVSATSLAAIAAFTQAGDIGAASAQVRDGIAGILASVPCARLQTTFIPETGQLELRGHIPENGLRGPVLAALQEQVGDAIPLSDQLLILPRPQCGALAGIADVGLPQSTEQLTDPAVIGEDGFARTYTYLDGERLRLDLTAPDYDSYVYMDYFVADGSVIHLQPNDIVPLEFAKAKSAQSVGRSRDDGRYLELTISAPFGQEIAAAFASSVPLYDGVRPIQEPAGPYLEFLKERVSAARAAHPDFKGEWVYFFISTKAD